MIDRRCFIQSSVALGAALATWAASGSSRRSAAPIGSASIVLVDRHLAGSAEFAADARSRDLDTLEFEGDVGGLWMREIEPRLRAGLVTIVGYTSAATWFCLDLLSRDFGASTVQRTAETDAVRFVISQTPGRRAALAPAAVRAQRSERNA
jgi:hypothetical protein